jgi:hypothetical protein
MVMNWGMSKRLGPVSYKLADEDPFLGRELHQHRQFSEHTMEQIDQEVLRHRRRGPAARAARNGYAIVDRRPDYVVVGEGRTFNAGDVEAAVRMILAARS